ETAPLIVTLPTTMAEPLPVIVAPLFSVFGALFQLRVAAGAIVIALLPVNPLSKVIVPLSTSTVPLFVNVDSTRVTPVPADLRNVPKLLKVRPPLSKGNRPTPASDWLSNSAPARLLKVAPPLWAKP